MTAQPLNAARAGLQPMPIDLPPGRALSLVGQRPHDTHTAPADEGSTPPAGANGRSAPKSSSPRPVGLADPSLYLAAEVVDDLERVRIANENRLRQLTRDAADADGEERGFGLPLNHPDVARLAGIVEAMGKLEHDAVLGLQRHMRAHPLGPWVKATKGVGEKQAARLIAAIGDPYWNTLHDRPRTVSELWAYCGLHTLPTDQHRDDAQRARVGRDQSGDPSQEPADTHREGARVAARRRKGQRANWSNMAKMRAYLCAQSCIKQTASPYRLVYDARRTHTAATHPDWTLGHSHNDALRIASKAILRDLWRAARDVHEAAP